MHYIYKLKETGKEKKQESNLKFVHGICNTPAV